MVMDIAQERSRGLSLCVPIDEVDACAGNLEVLQIWRNHGLKLVNDDLKT
jgi:hypothetical protein